MNLFTREQRPPVAAAEPGRPAPGILLTSTLDPDGCLRVLGQTLLSFRVPEYTYLPSFTSVGWAWAGGSAPVPETVISCADRTGDDVLVALWPARRGSLIGLFPLTGGDEQADRLDSSMLAPWRRHDTSLSGTVAGLEAGLIRLAPPVLAAGYAEEIVSAAGYRATRRNTQVVMRTAGSLFLARAQQFIEHREPRMARRFVRDHPLPQPMSAATLQEIVNDLARWNPGVLPYLQWMPVRTRAIMLERCQDRETFWGGLDR